MKKAPQDKTLSTMTEQATMPAVPTHVPAELVWDHCLDQFNMELDDPFLAGSRLHDGPDIIWATQASHGQPGWVITRHDLIEEAFLDYGHFSSQRGSNIDAVMGSAMRMLPTEVDPPEHRLYRRILTPCFTPTAIASVDDIVRGTCEGLIAKFDDKGGCEFIGDFARTYPNAIFLSLMGMPVEMLPQFLEWEDMIMRGEDQETHLQGVAAIMGYLKGFIEEQKQAPNTALIRAITTAEIGGRPINDVELLGMCFLLYAAGLDTVYSTLGWVMRYLASDQALQQRLRNHPEDIPQAVDEFARAFGVPSSSRLVTEDFTFHGVPMRKGDVVLLPTYLASRDPRAYDNPHVVDIDRRARNVSFATGPHACIGIHLAKREMRVVVNVFLSRFRNIRIPQGEHYEYHTGGVLGVDRLPLEWD
jgi:cytochrome P450